MKLIRVRVRHFRSIVDSGEVDIDVGMTALVGKNEAGKSALLEAIHAVKPLKPAMTLTIKRDYPNWLWKKHERDGVLGKDPAVSATYRLDPSDITAAESRFGAGTVPAEFTVNRYFNKDDVSLNVDADTDSFIRFILSDHDAQPEEALTSVEELRTFLTPETEEDETPEVLDDLETILGDGTLNSVVLNWLWKRTPRTLYFSDYAQLNGEYDLATVFAQVNEPDEEAPEDLDTAADFLRLANIDTSGAESYEYESMSAELQAVSNDLTEEMQEFWTQNEHLSLRVTVHTVEVPHAANQPARVQRFLRFEVEDSRHRYQSNLDRRSTGFKWFVSFMAAFFEHRADANLILLLDEPGLSLHARAQTDLLDAIENRVADSRQTIYSTHSPFMVRPNRLEQVRVVEDHGPKDGGTQVSADIVATDRDTLFPLQSALGYDVATNLFIGPHNVVIEGISDFAYLNYFRHRIGSEGGPTLRSSATLVPTRGVAKVPTFIALLGKPHLDLVVVVDGAQPDQGLARCITKGLVRADAVLCLGDGFAPKRVKAPDIEDLFDLNDYLRIYNDCYGRDVASDDLPEGDRIVKRLAALDGDFNHGQVAAHFVKHSDRLAPGQRTTERFGKLLSAVDQALET